MMWGESGARNYIRGNSVGAFLLRVLLFAFLSGGALAVIVLATRFIGLARAENAAAQTLEEGAAGE